MPGETTGGPTERPPRPRRERPVTRETVRPIDTREDVETALYDSFGLLEHTDDSKLSPELQWTKKAIRSSIDKSLDRDSDTVTVDYNGEYTKFRQEEGIPVDRLIDFLNDKLSDSRYDTAERKNLQEKINILRRNSTPFYDVDLARSNPEQMVARIRYEAHLISQDSRATGSELGDWELAKKELNKRRELFVTPQAPPVAEVETEEPVEVPTTETPASSPAPEPEAEFIGPPPPPAWAREILTVIGRRDEEIRNNALLERYQKIREEMRRGSLWDPRTWTRKIGLRLGEDYFGAKYLAKAIRAKLETGNTKAQAAFEGSAVDANHKRAEEQEAGKLGVKRAREEKLFEGEKVTEATGELKKKIVDGLLKPIIDGTITDEKQLQAKIKEFVEANQDNTELKAIFGPEASKYGNWADYFASDLLEMGASVRETMTTHAKTLEELDSYIKIKLANLSWTAETGAPKVGAIDKLVMKMQGGSKRGLIWNPATLGATASLGTAVGLRALGTTAQASQFIVPGVGAVVGGGVAGLRRYHDMNVDRAAAQIEDTYSQWSEGNAPRRESFARRDYDRTHVGELLNGSGEDLITGEERESLTSLLSKDLSEGQETNRQAVIRRIAEIEKRLDFSRKNSLDLVRYESEDKVQHGRLDLLEGTTRAREALRTAGMADEQIREAETRSRGEWEEKFIQNRDEQDRAFAGYRLRNAAGSALFGGLAGLGAGTLIQEGVAVTGRALGFNYGETSLEWAGKRIAEVGRAGRAAAAELPKPEVAAASTIVQEVQQGGPKASATISEVLQTTAVNKEIPVAQEWAKNAMNIDERIWEKGNDQFLHTIKKGNALGLDITRMTENVQQLVRNGEVVLAFTTADNQTVIISESSDAVKDGVLWLDPNSKNVKVAELSRMILNQNELSKLPDGDIATEVHNRRGVFNVKYVEAADLVKDGSKNILHTFATIQGTGNMPTTVEVPQTVETPRPTAETPKPVQPPAGAETPKPTQTPSPIETPRPTTTPIPSAVPSSTPTPPSTGGPSIFEPRPGEQIPAPPIIPIPFSPRHPLEPISERRAEPTAEEPRPEAPAPAAEPVTPPPPTPTPEPRPVTPTPSAAESVVPTPAPEPTREPGEAPAAPPAIEVGAELVQRDSGDKFTVVREDTDKVTLEKKREDETLESRVTLGREDLEEKLKTPGGAWSTPAAETKEPEVTPVVEQAEPVTFVAPSAGPTITPPVRLVTPPQPASPEAPVEAVTPEPVELAIGMKIKVPTGREYTIGKVDDEKDIVTWISPEGKDVEISKSGLEASLAYPNSELQITFAPEIPQGTPKFDSRGRIIGFEKPQAEVELPPTHPAAEEPLEITEPDTLEELELRKELTKLLHGQADPNMPIGQVRERLAQFKPTVSQELPLVDKEEKEEAIDLGEISDEAPFATEQGFVPTGDLTKDFERIRNMSPEELKLEAEKRRGQFVEKITVDGVDYPWNSDLKFLLAQEALAFAHGKTLQEVLNQDTPKPEEEKVESAVETEPKKEEERVEKLDAIIVLGKNIGEEWDAKRIRERKYQLSPHSRLSVLAAGLLYKAGYTNRIIFSTGYTAGKGLTESGKLTLSEAQAMKNRLLRVFPDIPEDAIELEEESLDTRGNAQKVKEILKKHAYTNVGLLTVGFHIPRAKMLFEKEGIEARVFASENVLKDRRTRFVENYLKSELVQKEIKKEKTAKLIQSMPLGPQLLRMVVKLTRGERVSSKIKSEKSAESEAVKSEPTRTASEIFADTERIKQELAERENKTRRVKTAKDEAMKKANTELSQISKGITDEKRRKRKNGKAEEMLKDSQKRRKRIETLTELIRRNVNKRRKKK